MAKKYPQFTEGGTVFWQITFYSDAFKTTPVNPSVVSFSLQKPDGSIVTPAPVSGVSTGVYSVTYVMDQWGLWDWRWTTESPTIAKQGTIEVIQENIP